MWAAQHCSRLFSSALNRLCVFTRVDAFSYKTLFVEGILPRHQQSHDFVQKQQTEQVEHLLRTLKVIKRLSEENDTIPSQIVQMYLLHEGEMSFMQPCEVMAL